MKALVHLLLLVGVLFGLATQGVALAAEPCPMEQTQSSAMVGMEDCCPEQDRTHHQSAPCGDMTFACMATAGCATLASLDTDGGDWSHASAAQQFWERPSALYGRTIPPDTHPPTRLG